MKDLDIIIEESILDKPIEFGIRVDYTKNLYGNPVEFGIFKEDQNKSYDDLLIGIAMIDEIHSQK